MQFTLLNRKTLANIPSASGIEVVGDNIFVMSDDSPWLFRLNNKYEIEQQIQVADTTSAIAGRIPKMEKLDLEAMAATGSGANMKLLLFGSGSKSPQRDVLIQMNAEAPHAIKKYPLVKFYDSLCADAKLMRNELNIETAVVAANTLYLFNRGKNRIFSFDLQKLLNHVENSTQVPKPKICVVTLPTLNGIEAGFSGATLSPDNQHIIFTASVENTPNPIDDGEILGSYVGLIPLDRLEGSISPDCIPIKDRENNVVKVKVESVAVKHQISTDTLKLLLVTDNDSSSSELIEAEFKW